MAGCAVGPNYRRPSPADFKVPATFSAAVPGGTQSATDLGQWWLGFADPVLSQLIHRALAANLDVDAAGSRVRQARAALRGVRGAQLPSLDVAGSAARTLGRDGGDQVLFQAGLDAAYEADLFGGVRRSVEAARADAQVALANLHASQLSIVAEVVLNYVDARLAQTRLRVARENLAAQDETLQIVGWRVQAGLVGALDIEQSRQLRAQTASSIPTIEVAYDAAVNRLAVLMAEPPGAMTRLLQGGEAIPVAPSAFAIPIPIDVIQRRPDIDAAERHLAAETARIGVQTAQRYPALRLSGSFGGSGASLGQLASASLGNVVASLTAPLFEGGRIRAAIDGQRASTAFALAAYRQAVLVALEEVENALVATSAAETRARELGISAQAARNSAIYARLQYRTGLIDFRTLLDAERSLLSTEDASATAAANRSVASIQLYKALGGGWQYAPEPASVAISTISARPR
jgi:multidrug efflux system outer membrane protein